MSANGLHPHAVSSHWSVIYDSLFLRAKQDYEDYSIVFESYPQWNLHRNFRSVRSKTGRPLLDEIRPSCALSYRLIQDQVLMRKCKADIDHLKPEFTVKCLVSYLTGWNTVEIPVMVAEYVLVPDDADEKAKHIAHLAMTMRSALALWEIHCLKGPVIGFLMERNIVETKLGWIDDDGKCIIRDAPEYRFDLMAPNETFRLFNFLKAYCQEPSRAQLERKVDEHAVQAIARLCEPTYHMWRDLPDDDGSGDEYGQDTGEIDIE
ncbi:hypothetical protein CPB85DRAFT_1441527 [Mucidula mucida]|nr:hypothetical protein CPB85DRAFT_1441527 [Mucidula mucida]